MDIILDACVLRTIDQISFKRFPVSVTVDPRPPFPPFAPVSPLDAFAPFLALGSAMKNPVWSTSLRRTRPCTDFTRPPPPTPPPTDVALAVVAVSVAGVVGGFVTVSSMYRKPCHVNWGTKKTSSPDAMAVDMYLWEEKSQGEEGGDRQCVI